MNYKPLIVIDDDNQDVLDNFLDKSDYLNFEPKTFRTWDKAKEFLEENKEIVDGVVIDAIGQINIESSTENAHVVVARDWVKKNDIPYVIYTAHSDKISFLKTDFQEGRIVPKSESEDYVIKTIKKEIENRPKLQLIKKYPEPFQCFGGKYLDKQYETLLLNVIKVFEDNSLNNPENLLFNPCRVILEQIFKKVNEVAERILPYALINFDNQKVGLKNCSRYLNGLNVKVYSMDGGRRISEDYQGDKILSEHISQQIQTIIAVCHPASHEIQNSYSTYTFRSVLWALFDVLIWLKDFVDKES